MVFGLHKMDPKTTKTDPETDQNRKSKIKIDLVRKIRDKTLQDALRTPQDAPTWCPRRPKRRPKHLKNPRKAAQKAPGKRHRGVLEPGDAQETPRAAQKLPRSPPDLDCGAFSTVQHRSEPRFWNILQTILYHLLIGVLTDLCTV